MAHVITTKEHRVPFHTCHRHRNRAGQVDILIKLGTRLPASAIATFEPQSHDQKKITVAIFEGLKPIGKHNHLVIKDIKLIEQAVKIDLKLTVSQIKIITTML